MKKLHLINFLPFFVLGIVGVLSIVHSSFSYQKIDTSEIQTSESLVFEIESIEKDEEGYHIVGLAYDIENVYEYNNWITGNGYNLYQNIQVIVYNQKEEYVLETISLYDSLSVYSSEEDIDFSQFRFKVAVPEKFEGFQLGIVSANRDNVLKKKLSERKVLCE